MWGISLVPWGVQYRRGYLSTVGDTSSTVGDTWILSTVGNIVMHVGEYYEYCGGWGCFCCRGGTQITENCIFSRY